MQKETLVKIAQVLTDYEIEANDALNSNLFILSDYLRSRGMIGIAINQRTYYIEAGWEGYPPGVPTLIVQVLNARWENAVPALRDRLGKLRRAMSAAGLLDWDDIAGWIAVFTEAPPEGAIVSPATVKLIVAALNANTCCSLGRDCEGMDAVRNGMVRDGLITKLDIYTCESCLEEPAEAPVVPVIPFVTKEV